MGRNMICSCTICHSPFAIRSFCIRSFFIHSFCIRSFFILLSLLLWVYPVGAQGGDPPTLTPTPTLTSTPLLTFTPTPTHAALRPDVEPFDGGVILENPLLWGLARRMLAGLGVANIRDYLAVVFALMGIARFIAKPPVGAE